MPWDFSRWLHETVEQIRHAEPIREIEALIHPLNSSVIHRQRDWQGGAWVIPPAVRHLLIHRPGRRVEVAGAARRRIHGGPA